MLWIKLRCLSNLRPNMLNFYLSVDCSRFTVVKFFLTSWATCDANIGGSLLIAAVTLVQPSFDDVLLWNDAQNECPYFSSSVLSYRHITGNQISDHNCLHVVFEPESSFKCARNLLSQGYKWKHLLNSQTVSETPPFQRFLQPELQLLLYVRVATFMWQK